MDPDGNTIETLTGSGPGDTTRFQTTLNDSSAYLVSVEVRDSTGLWSEPDQVAITVSYALPPTPVVTGSWDEETGAVIINIENPPTVEGEVDASHNELHRAIDGEDWELIATAIPLNTALTDYIPAVGTLNHYKVVAVSSLPSRHESDAATVSTMDHRWWVWVNAGPGFVTGVRVRDDAEVEVSSGRDKELRKFAGRRLPVEYTGEQRDRTISLSAKLSPESSQPSDIEYLADLPAPACIRTPDGQRYFVSTGEPSLSYRGMSKHMSWSFTEIDYIERLVHATPVEDEEEGN